MRIDGVASTHATRREVPHGQAGFAHILKRSRFSPDGYILDLTMEAMRQTGREDLHAARQIPPPPESYNQTGELAYYNPPTRSPAREPQTETVSQAPSPTVSFVAFDGMLSAL